AHRDRAALGQAVPHAAEEGDLVLLELHPGAAAVAEPAAGERVRDRLGGRAHAGRQSLDDRDERGTVRFACGEPTQHAPIISRSARLAEKVVHRPGYGLTFSGDFVRSPGSAVGGLRELFGGRPDGRLTRPSTAMRAARLGVRMSSTAGFGGAGATGAGSLARSTPQVYHDAVLASQQPDGRDAGAGSGSLPPLLPPPIDPSLGAFAPGTSPVRQGTESAPSSSGVPMQHEQGPPQHMPQGTPQAPQTQQVRPMPPQQQQASHDPQAQRQAGFPVARVFDGVKPDGGPLINRQNLDPREVPALQAYLTRAPVVLSAPGTTRDE